jgi:hypothetical protein
MYRFVHIYETFHKHRSAFMLTCDIFQIRELYFFDVGTTGNLWKSKILPRTDFSRFPKSIQTY